MTATLTGSSANGYNGSESVSATIFHSIDKLFADPSNTNSLTGENASTNPTWDLAATQTYNDGSVGASDLVFANFQTLNGGTVGDTFNVTVITSGFPMTLNGNGGSGDAFNIGYNSTLDPTGATGSLANVQDSVTINGAGATLNVSDAADTNAIALTMTAADIQSSSAGDIIYNGPSTINITTGDPTTNRNAIDVEGAVSGTTLVLTTTGNSDVQFAQVGQDFDSAFTGVTIILAGTSSDTLTVNDQANTTGTTYTVSDTGVTSTNASITINGQFGQEVVFGGSGTNHFDVTPSTVGSGTTISVDGGSGSSNTLTYHTPISPPDAPVNDGSSSIFDTGGNYEPVYYYDFLTETIYGPRGLTGRPKRPTTPPLLPSGPGSPGRAAAAGHLNRPSPRSAREARDAGNRPQPTSAVRPPRRCDFDLSEEGAPGGRTRPAPSDPRTPLPRKCVMTIPSWHQWLKRKLLRPFTSARAGPAARRRPPPTCPGGVGGPHNTLNAEPHGRQPPVSRHQRRDERPHRVVFGDIPQVHIRRSGRHDHQHDKW